MIKAQSIRITAIAIIFLGFFAVRTARAQQQHQRGPSTAEERARAIKIAHELENDPLGKDALDNR